MTGEKREREGFQVEGIKSFINNVWDENVIPKLEDYIRIPNLSPMFEPDWSHSGHTEKALNLIVEWANSQDLKGMKLEVLRQPERTPLIFITVDPTHPTDETIMMYGHMDKQPPCEGWMVEKGIKPYDPIIIEDKLYGRGSADDGYSIFTAITSLKALQKHGHSHARIVIIIEACEESGSPDLPFYIQLLKPRIGTPSLIICLDSGCGNYEQFWITTSLRGMCSAELKVEILKEGVHSGHASGIVPSSFRILRKLLNRVENVETGEITLKDLHVSIPEKIVSQTEETANELGHEIYEEFPFVEGAHPVSTNLTQLLLNRTWRPTLSVTGVGGFPALSNAGNVLRTHSTFMLSFRLPPTLHPEPAAKAIKEVFEKDPPYGAKVTCSVAKSAPGWAAPEMQEWLLKSVDSSSQTFFQKPARFIGEGGSIPFMGMLGEMFPKAQFVITGLLGPKSNAHGPNEFLHIPMAKKLTCCISSIVFDHYHQLCEQSKHHKK